MKSGELAEAFGLKPRDDGLVPALVLCTMAHPTDDLARRHMWHGLLGHMLHERLPDQFPLSREARALIRNAPPPDKVWTDFESALLDGGMEAGRILLGILRKANQDVAAASVTTTIKQLADHYRRLPAQVRPRCGERSLWQRWDRFKLVSPLWAAYEIDAREKGRGWVCWANADELTKALGTAQELHRRAIAIYPSKQAKPGSALLPSIEECFTLANGAPWPAVNVTQFSLAIQFDEGSTLAL